MFRMALHSSLTKAPGHCHARHLMQGTPADPRCGFSHAAVKLLHEYRMPEYRITTCDVRENAELHRAIREYSCIACRLQCIMLNGLCARALVICARALVVLRPGFFLDHCYPFGAASASSNAGQICNVIVNIWKAEMGDDGEPLKYKDNLGVLRFPHGVGPFSAGSHLYQELVKMFRILQKFFSGRFETFVL
ncbi:hypothetical protein B0H17DRAFT_1208282 [Mycena rosella]|uniref:Uncharacterized protein n=1 Tax=Mycena rosella TaxID=1033263 RepID=A0AAD7D1I4_MYCRO|nr:hypothetical protein B0H17DRAFT_1208282 [Mycena rosella]